MLRRQARQLIHAVKILEGIGEGLAAVSVQHLLDRDLFSCLIFDRFDIVGIDIVFGKIFLIKILDLFLAHLIHFLDQIADGPGVDLPA